MAKMNAQLARAEVWSEIEPAAPSESASPEPSPGEIVGERP
uniref:Minor tail protein n=1 Tax=Mycobacterium phage Farewell TaxID=3158893 RepID=A0AAU8GLI8_9CAUD